MEICFVPDNDYGKFLDAAKLAQRHRGEIVNLQGQVLGHHDGDRVLHHRPAQGAGPFLAQTALRHRTGQRQQPGGGGRRLGAGPRRIHRRAVQLDSVRRAAGRNAGVGQNPLQPSRNARHRAPAARRQRAGQTAGRRNAPSRPARPASFTTAIWCWAAAGSPRTKLRVKLLRPGP